MRTLAVVAAVSLLSGAAVARAHAQEPAAPVDEREKAANEAPRHLQVLQNPYDISSFYRSSQSPAGFGYEPMAPSRYPIAGFYRSQHAPGTYGMFWTSGAAAADRWARRARALWASTATSACSRRRSWPRWVR